MTSHRNYYNYAAGAALALSCALGVAPAFAQTTGTQSSVETRNQGAVAPTSGGVTGLTGNGTTVGGTNATSGTVSGTTSGLTGSSFTSDSSISATTATAIPGLPNTGAGGNIATVWSVLAAALIVFLGGSALLARKITA
ncbi:MAG: hypothetical protein V4674_04290 [Patescibacteria group bacterium]